MGEINWFGLGLNFLAGFGLFLFGMEFMGEGLQKAAGSKMKNLLGVLTSNRFLGVLVGAGVTALIQSSSATTVMVVGFVNAGLMSLTQAVGVIMGANIGTTVTAWIVSLGQWTEFLKPSVLAPIFIVVGVGLIMFAKKSQIKSIGQILFGFGSLFLGLDMMSSAAKPLSKLEEIRNLFVILGNSPLLGVLIGAVVTAIIQSSSASVGILQALALAGLVPWSSAIYIILGQNIGTCVTALLSSIGAGINAKRAAFIHFLFNVIGSLIFMVVAIIAFKVVVPQYQNILINVTDISIVHTTFNVLNTLLLFPFSKGLVYLAEHIITGKSQKSEQILQHLDERILETPSFAIENVIKEVIRMGEITSTNVNTGIKALFEKDEKKIQEVFEQERTINAMQQGINAYLVKLSNVSLSEKEQLTVTELFHMVSDIERVGDHADNIAELAVSLKEDNLEFSDQAKQELQDISNIALNCFETALKAYEFRDKNLANQVIPLEMQVDKLEEKLRSRHMKRLIEEKCNPLAGIIFLDMISNVERISDHASNIGLLIIDEARIMMSEE